MVDQVRDGLFVGWRFVAVEEVIDAELDEVRAGILGGLGLAESGGGIGGEDGDAEEGHGFSVEASKVETAAAPATNPLAHAH